MNYALIIALVAVNALWLFCFLKYMSKMLEAQDLLLERIRNPDYRPIPLQAIPTDSIIESTDLAEYAAVGQIDPDLNE